MTTNFNYAWNSDDGRTVERSTSFKQRARAWYYWRSRRTRGEMTTWIPGGKWTVHLQVDTRCMECGQRHGTPDDTIWSDLRDERYKLTLVNRTGMRQSIMAHGSDTTPRWLCWFEGSTWATRSSLTSECTAQRHHSNGAWRDQREGMARTWNRKVAKCR